jgi:hypothetical protein
VHALWRSIKKTHMNKKTNQLIIGASIIALGIILTYLGKSGSYATKAGDDVSLIAGVVLLIGGIAFFGIGLMNKAK